MAHFAAPYRKHIQYRSTVEKKNFMLYIMKSSLIVGVLVVLAFAGSSAAAFGPEIGRVQLSSLLQNSVGKMLSEFGQRRTIAKRQTVYDVTTKDVVDCISSTTEYQCGTSGYSQRVVDIAMGCNNNSYARNTANTCARNQDGETCGAVTLKFLSDYTDAEACSGAVASGSCPASCREFLQSARDMLGCCVNAYVNRTEYPLYRQSRDYVDYRLWNLCGVDLPDGECKDGGLRLKSSDDQKSCSSQELISRFVKYECETDVGQSLINNLMRNGRCYIFSSVMVDACSTNSNGEYCAEVIGIDLMANVISDPLVIALNSYCLPGSGCSSACKKAMIDIKEAYGCCVNIYNDTSIGLQLTPLSYEKWNECGIETPGFCDTNQVIPTIPPMTTTEEIIDTTEDVQTTEEILPTEIVTPEDVDGTPVDFQTTQPMEEDGPSTTAEPTTEIAETTESIDDVQTTDIVETEEPTEELLPTDEDIDYEMTDPTDIVPTEDEESLEPMEPIDGGSGSGSGSGDLFPDDFETTEPTDSVPSTSTEEEESFEPTEPTEPSEITDRVPPTPLPGEPREEVSTEGTQSIMTTGAIENTTPESTDVFETTDAPDIEPTDIVETTENMETTEIMENEPTTIEQDIATTEAREDAQNTQGVSNVPTESTDQEPEQMTTDHSNGEDHTSFMTTEPSVSDHSDGEDHTSSMTTEPPDSGDHSDGEDHTSTMTTVPPESDHSNGEDHTVSMTTDHSAGTEMSTEPSNASPVENVDNAVSGELPSSRNGQSVTDGRPNGKALSDSAPSTRAFVLTILSTAVVTLFSLYL